MRNLCIKRIVVVDIVKRSETHSEVPSNMKKVLCTNKFLIYYSFCRFVSLVRKMKVPLIMNTIQMNVK